jgi:hypothetical protein
MRIFSIIFDIYKIRWKKLSKNMRIILLIAILSNFKLNAQIELSLSQLKVKQFGNEYDANYIITGPLEGADLTYLTKNYSADSTRFYYHDELFSGICTINSSDQSNAITFQNGKLHGHWRAINWSNDGLYTKGYFKDGLKEGWWSSGYADRETYKETLETRSESEEETLGTREEYDKGKLIRERYYYRDWTTMLSGIQGYREITYHNGQAEDVHKYMNMENFRGENTLDGKTTSGPKNGTETYYVSKDSILKNVLLFDNGYILSKSTFKNDTLLKIDKYTIDGTKYNIHQTYFYSNGNIESKGSFNRWYNAKSGEWLFYNKDSLLIKKEVYHDLLSRKPITTYYNSDGSVK